MFGCYSLLVPTNKIKQRKGWLVPRGLMATGMVVVLDQIVLLPKKTQPRQEDKMMLFLISVWWRYPRDKEEDRATHS